LVERERTRELSLCFCLRFGRTIRDLEKTEERLVFSVLVRVCVFSPRFLCVLLYTKESNENIIIIVPFRRPSLRVDLEKNARINRPTMSHNTGTGINHIEEERKMIRVQSVLALCERCPAIKSTYKGFANKDTIAPLPHTERIPDPVAIIAKNLSKERKHYLQKVRARGMPERFSVSLAKPRDWRRTVKVRAPKRRQMRLKVEEQREREEELERRQRHRRREGLVSERSGGGRTTTAKKTKNTKKKKNDDDDSEDDENKNSNENETATTTTKTRRKREEDC
jgi:hypothetical protein